MGRLLNPQDATFKSPCGVFKTFSIFLKDGVQHSFGPYGYVSGNFEFNVIAAGQGAPGRYYCTANNTVITQERAAGGVTKSDLGSEPGSGLVRIWKDGVTEALKVKAVGSNVLVTFTVFAG